MPLSEDEQRILRDIERNFYEHDPKFAESVSSSSLYRHAKRKIVLSVAGIVVSLGVLLGTFFISPWLAFVGFVGMVTSAFFAVQNIRRVGSVGLKDAADSERAQKMNESLNGAADKMKRRFRRP